MMFCFLQSNDFKIIQPVAAKEKCFLFWVFFFPWQVNHDSWQFLKINFKEGAAPKNSLLCLSANASELTCRAVVQLQ